MSVSVSMPQLGESVTEGTVTRWLKQEGEHVQADEPLLEVSTDKVDTEIPSPVSGILRGITVAEDETVAVGAELAVIDEDGAAGQSTQAAAQLAAPAPQPAAPPPVTDQPAQDQPVHDVPVQPEPVQPQPVAAQAPQPSDALPPEPEIVSPDLPAPPAYESAVAYADYDGGVGRAPAAVQFTDGADGPYVTPLVRKLAAEHGIDLASVTGTGVGGRIRKQDILDAAALQRGPATGPAQPAADQPATVQPATVQPRPALVPPTPVPPTPVPPAPVPSAPPQVAAPPAAPAEGVQYRARPAIVPSSLRGTTERMSRARQVIAQRMVESLQTSAQLTTVVEADVTAIARLRDRAKAAFEAREGVKLSFLPFFALATVEALKVHPKLNAVIDAASGQVTYHDAEHLGIAVDTERGLMVPVVKNAGDLNIGGLARKIADLASRTRASQVSPDDLSGGTFTITNTGSRGALLDTPIINQPQVGILGTGSVVKRAVVVEDATLGEVITVRSMVYLALTYDHRLVDGADAARFLLTIKERLEEGAFETELGL